MAGDVPDADELGLELLPEEDVVSPEEDVEAAVASALAPDFVSLPGQIPTPLGRTWRFDWSSGRFFRRGSSPAEARGPDALIEWCQMALHSGRFAHAFFGDDFGVEDAEDPIGSPATAENKEEQIRRAFLQHDRIAAVDNVQIVGDPATGDIQVRYLEVITDDDDRIEVPGG